MDTKILATKDIAVFASWNPRANYGDIDALAEDLKKNGQDTPVIVAPVLESKKTSKPYMLVAGFRRMAALEKAGIDKVRAQIVVGMSDAGLMALNARENLIRKNLTTYELALCLQRLRDAGLSATEIAKAQKGDNDPEIAKKREAATDVMVSDFKAGEVGTEGGLSKSYINKLINLLNRLHPDILEGWKGADALCTVPKLVEWSPLDHVEQKRRWDIAHGKPVAEANAEAGVGASGGASDGGGTASTATPAAPAKMLPRATIQAAYDAAKEGEHSEAVKVLGWVLGMQGADVVLKVGRATIYDPAKAAAKADEAAKAERIRKAREELERAEKGEPPAPKVKVKRAGVAPKTSGNIKAPAAKVAPRMSNRKPRHPAQRFLPMMPGSVRVAREAAERAKK